MYIYIMLSQEAGTLRHGAHTVLNNPGPHFFVITLQRERDTERRRVFWGVGIKTPGLHFFLITPDTETK